MKIFLPFVLVCSVLFLSGLKFKNAVLETVEPEFLKGEKIWAKKTLASLSLEEKIAQFFMVASWSNKNEAHQLEIENLVKNSKIGGIIYFQGNTEQLKKSISRMQLASKTPLMIGMDAEWGVGMRVDDMSRFPFSYTIGTANDLKLSERMASMMAQECRELGVHINFAPVADVNSNPKNPVIGFRSFGENPDLVSRHVAAFVRGMEQNGILTSIKHFPGHGDTDKDSHYELPTLSHSKQHFDEVELKPFHAGIHAGASSVMIGHLNVPALDDSKTPSSLSPKIIQDLLKKKMDFQGLVISDALNMKAVADKYGKVDVVVKAFQSGIDILLFPENVDEAIQAIASKVKSGEISLKEIDERCLKILKAKEHLMYFRPKTTFTQEEIAWTKRESYEKSLTVLKNKNALPLTNYSNKMVEISIGVHTESFSEMSNRFQKSDKFHFYSFEEAAERMKNKWLQYDVVITSIHCRSVLASTNFSSPGKLESLTKTIPLEMKHVGVLFGNPMLLAQENSLNDFDAFVVAYENNNYAQEAAAQLVYGAIGTNSKLAFTVSDILPINSGIEVKAAQRLKFSQPEELNISRIDLQKIDEIVEKGLKAKAFPGCQILLAVEGKIIYQKSFGTVTYEDTTAINENHVYDIASISKIVGSTAALMRLESQKKFKLDSYIKDYIPDLVGNSKIGNIFIRHMMAHQAGFTPWIAFYKATVKNGILDNSIYSSVKKTDFQVPVADNLWIRNDYEETIYTTILSSPLTRNPKYEYSDLGYYFAKKIIEKQSQQSLDHFMYNEYFDPMGLSHIRYLPLLYFPKSQIIPTENDTIFRGQEIHGFVHDPGAAMLGGVGGHAGIFSNSYDLASMMQLYLNKGFYANRRYIDESVLEEYTSQQLGGNRRGAGFDRQTQSHSNSPCSPYASNQSFGHSGFTGTFTWADPELGINYVFLSNRVSPDAANKKIQEMHTRVDIQSAIYEAVLNSKKK